MNIKVLARIGTARLDRLDPQDVAEVVKRLRERAEADKAVEVARFGSAI